MANTPTDVAAVITHAQSAVDAAVEAVTKTRNTQNTLERNIAVTDKKIGVHNTDETSHPRILEQLDSMFYDCRALASLDVSTFNTSSATNIVGIFQDCSALTSINVSGLDFSSTTSLSGMFNNCRSLTSIDVSSFDTSNITNMEFMFKDCRALTSLDVSNFDTSNVITAASMFQNCYALETIYASSAFVTTQMSTSTAMFGSCESIVGGAGTVYVTSPTDKTYAHIDGGTADPGYFTAKA